MTSYQIEGPWPGRLAIVPRPRGGDWLADEVRAWKEAGFDIIVSLLTTSEATDLGLADEADFSRAYGLTFYNFQIPDMGVPQSMASAHEFLDQLSNDLNAGKNIAVHCRQGIGRSGLISAGLLSLFGTDPETAFQQVSASRGLPVPETAKQIEWVMHFARELPVSVSRR